MTKTEEDKMKQWKLVLVALLSVLLVCTCMSALASETETVPAHKCTPAEDIVVDATCGANGSITRQNCTDENCPNGNNKVQTSVIPATGKHATSVGYWTEAPTCTKDGKIYYYCPTCHGNKTDKVLPATGHKLDDGSLKTSATCEANGVNVKKCTNKDCTYTEDVVFPATGHNKVINEIIAPTCTEEGKTVYGCKNGCGKTWDEDIKPALGHKFTKVAGHSDSTCTKDGYNIYQCANGDCTELSETEVLPATGHTFTGKKVVGYSAPTCTENGGTAYQCENEGCNEKQIDSIAATGHDWEFKETVKPVCKTEKDGYDLWICKNCGAADERNVVKFAHDFSNLVENKEPTCSQKGMKVWECSVCGKKDVQMIDMADHVPFDTWEVYEGNEATCTLEGQEVLCCVNCGAELARRSIPALGHDWSETNPDKKVEPTCTKDGKDMLVCAHCGMNGETVVVPATGHTYTYDVKNEATCTLDGIQDIGCENCDYEELNVIIKATGHKATWKVVVEPTPEADGLAKKICDVCGEEVDRKVVPYTVMRYSNTLTSYGPTTRELVGGNDWYRVTPIDLTVEGTFTYPLVASNQYVVGTVTVVIANGTLTVSYDTAASQIKVTAESLLIYSDLAALAAGNAQEFAFGTPIAIGEDTNVIISVLLTADYNAIGAGVTGFSADDAQIEAMKSIIQ